MALRGRQARWMNRINRNHKYTTNSVRSCCYPCTSRRCSMPSSDSIHDSHPKAIPPPQVAPPPRDFRGRAKFVKHKLTTRRGWLGDYDYAWLCLPSLPFYKRSKRPPPFYALDAELPLTLAIFTGFQHALAMLAGMNAVIPTSSRVAIDIPFR